MSARCGRRNWLLGITAAFTLAVVSCGAPAPNTSSPVSPSAPATASPAGFGQMATGGSGLALCLAAPSPACVSATVVVHAQQIGRGALLAAPINLTATAVGNTVTLVWTAPAGAVAAYIVEAGSSSGLANLATFSTGNALTTLVAPGVPAGTYYVRMRAVDATGAAGPASNEVVLSVGGCVAPGPPTGLTVIANSGGTVSLAWTAGSGAASYVIEAGSAPSLSNLTTADIGAATTFTANGVGAGTYYVRVRARSACGASAPSNEIALVVGGGTPSIPPGVRAVIDGVPWTATNTDAILSRGSLTVVGSAAPWSFSFLVDGSLGTHQITPAGPDNAHVSPYPPMPGIAPSWQTAGAPPVGGGSGTVTIVSISATSAAGTFQFVLLPYIFTGASGTKVITGGTFNVPVRFFP